VPAAIAAAIAAEGTALYSFIYVVATVVINYGLSRISQQLSGKPKRTPGGTRGRDVTARGTVEPRQIIYGQIKAGGFIAYLGLSGIRNKYLHIVVVYAAHECEEISDLWIDERRAPTANINGSTGEVTASGFTRDGQSYLYAWKHLGTSTQTADAELLAASGLDPAWSSAHRGAGLAYVHYRLEYNEEVWPNGAPQSLFALTKGRRVYDPRLDSTNGGSGSQRYNDARTWTWSNNWALCVRDYIAGGSVYYDVATPNKMLGYGEDDARIDDAYTIAAANISDEACPIPNGSGGSTTEARYTCDTQLSCGDVHKENLEILKSAGVGAVDQANGKYRINAGAFETPTITLTGDDIKGKMVISTSPQGEDLYNMVTGTFYDENRDWQLQTFPSITNSSFEADDGNRQLPRNIELHATRGFYRAQRIGMLHEALSREKLTIHFSKLSPKAMQIAEGATFMLTTPDGVFTNKVLKCKTWEFPPSGWPILTARECNSSRYATPAYTDYVAPGAAVATTPQYDEPDTPINFSAVSMREGIFFRWQAQPPVNSNQVYVLYEHTSQTPFSSAVEVWRGKSLNVLLERPGQTVRYYWLTAQLNDTESAPTPTTNGLAAAPFVQGFDEQFHDSFEHQDYTRFYNVREIHGASNITYPTNGENGGRVLRAQGYLWIGSNRNIPYDPNALYLITAKVRLVASSTNPAHNICSVGLEGVAADGTTLISLFGANTYTSAHYAAADTFDMNPTFGSWVTFRGYMSGLSATPSPFPAPDITNPLEGYSSGATVVRFIRPMLRLMAGPSGDGIMEVDYIKLEKVVLTSQIGPNAATELYSVAVAGPVTVTALGGGASSGSDIIASVDVTPSEDGHWIITASYEAEFTGADALGTKGLAGRRTNISGVIETVGDQNIQLTTTRSSQVARSMVEAIPNVVNKLGLFAGVGTVAGDLNFYNIVVTAEFIKR
jgi:hypothetical protein